MAHQAGRASDEYGVDAGDLNQSFIGLTVGYNAPDGTVYGKLAAAKVSDDEVHIWLDGFVAGDVAHIVVDPHARLFFARTSGDWQLREAVDRVLGLLQSHWA